MPSVFEAVSGLLAQGDTMERLGGALGTNSTGTKRAVDAATPALLGGLADKVGKPGGIDALSGMLDQAERSPQADPGGMFSGTPDLGTGMLDGIFGSNRGGLLNRVAESSGVGSGVIGKLLPMLAPVVMGVLAKRRAADGLDGNGMARLLTNERDELEGGGLLGSLGSVGKVGAGVGAGAAAVGATAGRGRSAVEGGVSNIGDRARGAADIDRPKKGGFGWLWWLLGALLLLAVGAWALSQCGGTDDLTDAAGGVVDDATDAAGDAVDEAGDAVDDATDAAGDAADEVTDAAGDAADEVTDAVDGDDDAELDLQPAVDDALGAAGISGVTAAAGDDGVVTLTGSVEDDAARTAAEEAVAGVEGVASVDNQLEVAAAEEEAADEAEEDESAAPASGSTINELLDLAPITFAVNSADITTEGQAVLDEAVAFFEANPDVNVEIGGHTDSDGDDASNLTLSQARADSVKAYLEAGGIDGARMTTQGYGETEPVADNDTDEGKATNRRIEFTVQ